MGKMITISISQLDTNKHDDNEQSDTDSESYKEMCRNLRSHSKRVDKELDECMKRFKIIRRKVQEEQADFTEAALQPRPDTLKWLKAHDISATPTFQEFFSAFLQAHKDNERLDISARTIRLHKDALTMFGFTNTQEEPICLLKLLSRMPEAFY
jgi:hypothetical protein